MIKFTPLEQSSAKKNYDQVRQFQCPVRQFYCLARQLQYVLQVFITLGWWLSCGPPWSNTSGNVGFLKNLCFTDSRACTSPVRQFQYSVRQFYCLAWQLLYVPQVRLLVLFNIQIYIFNKKNSKNISVDSIDRTAWVQHSAALTKCAADTSKNGIYARHSFG